MGLKLNPFKAIAAKTISAEPSLTVPSDNYASNLSSEMTSMMSSREPSIRSGMSSGMSTPKKGYVEEIRHEVMCNYLYQQQSTKLWIDEREELEQGVVIRKSKGTYVAAPPDLAYSRFAANCSALNLLVNAESKCFETETDTDQSAMTVSSKMIRIFLDCSPDAVDVPLRNGLRVQVVPNLEDLKRVRIHQCAAFIANEKLLVVWDDEPSRLLARAQQIEDELMALVWEEEPQDVEFMKNEGVIPPAFDEETGASTGKRPTLLYNTIYTSLTLTVMFIFVGLGIRAIAIEMKVDKNYLRMLFILIIPIQCFFSLVRIML